MHLSMRSPSYTFMILSLILTLSEAAGPATTKAPTTTTTTKAPTTTTTTKSPSTTTTTKAATGTTTTASTSTTTTTTTTTLAPTTTTTIYVSPCDAVQYNCTMGFCEKAMQKETPCSCTQCTCPSVCQAGQFCQSCKFTDLCNYKNDVNLSGAGMWSLSEAESLPYNELCVRLVDWSEEVHLRCRIHWSQLRVW